MIIILIAVLITTHFAFLKKKNCADINYKYDEMKNYVKTHANYFQLHIHICVDFPHTQLLLLVVVVAGFNPNIFTYYA